MPSTSYALWQLETRPLTKATSSLQGSPYTPLPSNTIRLFRLLQYTRDSGFHGELAVKRLGDCPKYKAVSYTWGGENQDNYSVIKFNNDQTLHISQALNCLLLSLWNSLGADAPPVWIDQICIDQADKTEKEHQLGLMREIYSGADNVLVWLRDNQETHKISLAIQTAQILQSYTGKPGMASVKSFLSLNINDTKSTGDSSLLNGVSEDTNSVADNGLSALLSLWRHPWFERLWVRPEVVLAKNITFRYGGQDISREELAKACNVHYNVAMSFLFSEAKANENRTTLSQGTALRQETAESFHQLSCAKELFDMIAQGVSQETHLRLDLLDLFRYTFNLGAAKEHDRVYAIYHLSSAASNRNLWPDYSKPLGQLWQELAAYVLKNHSYWNADRKQICACPAVILALPATQNRVESPNSKSWVPDFANLSPRSAVKFDHWWYYSDTFKAGGPKGFHPIIDQNGSGMLRLEGVVLSRVNAVERDTQQPLVGGSVPLEFESTEYWNLVTEKLFPWYLKCHRFAKEHCLGDFGDLLCQGVGLPSDMKLSEQKGKQKGARGRKRKRQNSEESKVGGIEVQSPEFSSFSERVSNTFLAGEEGISTKQLYDDLLPFIVNVAWTMDTRDWTRVLATLSDGNVGWMPETVKNGDYVVLIKGTPFPFVVRQDRHSPFYKMIGDAYISGIMKGEAWEEKASHVYDFEFI